KSPINERTDDQLKKLRGLISTTLQLLEIEKDKVQKDTAQALDVPRKAQGIESDADRLLDKIDATLKERHPQKKTTAMAKTCFCWLCMVGKQPYYMGPAFVFDDQRRGCNNEDTDPKQLYPNLHN